MVQYFKNRKKGIFFYYFITLGDILKKQILKRIDTVVLKQSDITFRIVTFGKILKHCDYEWVTKEKTKCENQI